MDTSKSPKNPLKVLFLTDRAEIHQRSALATAPCEVEVVMLKRPDRKTLLTHLAKAEILITERQGVVDAEAIAAAPRLQLIQRLGTQIFDIDLEAARKRAIPVCKHPLPTCIAVAEHTLMLILSLLKHLPEVTRIALEAGDWGTSRQSDENTFAFNWSRRQNIGCLKGKKIGILGYGEIGAELARRLSGFSPDIVLYHKRRRLPETTEQDLNITYSTRSRLLGSVEILVVLLPFSAETHHLIDFAALKALPQGALVVHCGSGGIIDEQALAEVVTSGHLGGAALDTFEWEPLRPHNPLLSLAKDPRYNVILTPHTAAATLQLAKKENRDIWENVRRLLAGQPLQQRII